MRVNCRVTDALGWLYQIAGRNTSSLIRLHEVPSTTKFIGINVGGAESESDN